MVGKEVESNALRADALTFDLLSIGGKLRAGFGALGIKKAAPGNPSRYAVYFLPFCLYAKPLKVYSSYFIQPG